LTDPVADEHAIDAVDARAAFALLRQDRPARGFQALLVAIGVAVGEVSGDRGRQMRGRAEAKSSRIADVEFQHGVPGGLECPRAARERPADFIADLSKM